MEARGGGSIRTLSDVSEVSKDCNLTFGQSLPELSSAPIGNNIPYILRRWALLVSEAGMLCVVLTGQMLQFPLETCDGTSVFCLRNIPRRCVYK